MNRKEKTVKELKAAAETIYNNAERIIGGYKSQTGDVDIMITINGWDAPRITVDQELLPDNINELYK